MTTIPLSSFETPTGIWTKGALVPMDYFRFKSQVSVDSSDLRIKFTDLPANMKVENPPNLSSADPDVENQNVFIDFKHIEIRPDLSIRGLFTYSSLYNSWGLQELIYVRHISDGEFYQYDFGLVSSSMQIFFDSHDQTVRIVGEFTFYTDENAQILPCSIDDVIYPPFNDIQLIGHAETTFGSNLNGTVEMMNIGPDFIINTYTKIDDSTISIPRNTDTNFDYLSNISRLYVNFSR